MVPHGRSFKNRSLEAQRLSLEQGGRLQWLHRVVVIVSVVLAVLVWRYTSALVDERARVQFDRLTTQVVDLVHDRFDGYVDALRGTAGFVGASERVTLDEWRAYAASLDLEKRFPALLAFGVAYTVPSAERDRFVRAQRRDYPAFEVFPDHDGPVHLPIALIWPERLERTAIGLDMARESSRRDALQRSLASGLPQMTRKISLGVSGNDGLILMAPFSRPAGGGARHEPVQGVAAASVYASELLTGLNDDQGRRLAIRMADQDGVIYEDENYASVAPSARFATERRFSAFGRDLVFETRSTSTFYDESLFSLPSIVLVVALLIDALVFALIFTLIRSNRRALHYAGRAGEALRREREELAASNRELSIANGELGNFGHALSHDLRTPLNSIQSLVEFAEEDLEEADVRPAVRKDIESHLRRTRRQVDRGKSLITGMLDYAGLGTGNPEPSRVDVREMLVDIGEGLRLGPDRLELPDELPVLRTCSTRLDQVFANLVGNALKYHPTPETACIRIEAVEQEGMVRFAVDDDGVGIEPQYREKVFELFQTLQSRDDIESSGVGLSIVKKSVEQVGGSVTVEQAELGGARFVFTWPSEMRGAA